MFNNRDVRHKIKIINDRNVLIMCAAAPLMNLFMFRLIILT